MDTIDFHVIMSKLYSFRYRATEEKFKEIFPDQPEHLFRKYESYKDVLLFWQYLDYENQKHFLKYVRSMT